MNYRKYDIKLKNEIFKEIEDGESKRSISVKYDVPRSTIVCWWKNKDKDKNNIKLDFIKNDEINIDHLNKESYSYIFGLYLGDGYINKMKRTYRLRVFLDSRQDLVIEECVKNMEKLFPSNKVNILKTKHNFVIITLYSNYLPIIFPQHGPKQKCERNIELEDFQKKIIIKKDFMKGLFHSDGSFYLAKNEYPRYLFTNKSKQILDMFADCLIEQDIIPKIRKRKNDIYDIQIQNIKDVKKLYEILGEKYKEKRWK